MLRYFNLIFAFLVASGCSFASGVNLFDAAREAVRAGYLDAKHIVGLDTAEKLAQAMRVDDRLDGRPPQLKVLLEEMYEKFPGAAADHLMPVPEDLTWRTYALAVQEIINWKSPQDETDECLPGFCGVSWGGKNEKINFFKDDGFISIGYVRFGFVPTPDGELGEATILLCLAHRLAIFGLPTNFSKIAPDHKNSNYNTVFFVKHDAYHNSGIYGIKEGIRADLKMQWVLSGALQSFLGQITLTSVVVRYLFQQIWEGFEMDINLRYLYGNAGVPVTPEYVKQQEEIFGLFCKLYISFYPETQKSKKELEEAFLPFKSAIFSGESFLTSWVEMPAIFARNLKPEEIPAFFRSKLLRMK